MYVDWLEEKISLIEKAIAQLTDSLQRDDPNRRDKTRYDHPKEEYVAEVVQQVLPACRSVLLTSRLIRVHLDNSSYTLKNIDLPPLITEQQMWQRRLSETLTHTILLADYGSNDYFSAYLLRSKSKNRGIKKSLSSRSKREKIHLTTIKEKHIKELIHLQWRQIDLNLEGWLLKE